MRVGRAPPVTLACVPIVSPRRKKLARTHEVAFEPHDFRGGTAPARCVDAKTSLERDEPDHATANHHAGSIARTRIHEERCSQHTFVTIDGRA